MARRSRFARTFLLVLVAITLLAATTPDAEALTFGGAGIDKGAVAGVIVGIVVVIAAAVTFLVLHEEHRGIVVGCIAGPVGRKTLVTSGGKVYTLAEGPAVSVGDRVKLKGHRSGPNSSPIFQVDRVLADYGRCPQQMAP